MGMSAPHPVAPRVGLCTHRIGRVEAYILRARAMAILASPAGVSGSSAVDGIGD